MHVSPVLLTQVIKLLKGEEEPDNSLLPIITPMVLSEQRQQYLFNENREFVAEEHRDTVCPAPTTPTVAVTVTASTSGTSQDSACVATTSATPAQKKRGRPQKSPRGLAAKTAKAKDS